MDTKTIFVLTPKGEDEVSHKTSLLYGDMKRALSMMDGVSSFAEISKRAAPSLRSMLAELVRELVLAGYIQDKARAAFAAKIVVPNKPAPVHKPTSSDELDFTTMMRAPSAEVLRAEAEKIQAAHQAQQAAETEKLRVELERVKQQQIAEQQRAEEQAAELKAQQQAQLKQQAELQKQQQEIERKAKEQAEAARLKAEQEAERLRKEAELTRQKAEAEAKLREETECKAKEQAEAARVKAEQEAERLRKEAELTRQKAEAEAKLREETERKAKEQAEAARVKAEQEAERLRKEAELTRQKAEAEAKLREEAERKAKEQAEAARLKAEQEAERLRKEAELVRQKAEAEAKLREETERKAKEQAEAARVKAEQEAERLRKEAELTRQKAEAEAKLREEAERKAKEQAEAARVKAEQEAERVRAELAAVQRQAEQESLARQAAESARLLAEQQAAQASVAVEQAALQEREVQQQLAEQQAALAREEEQKRAKQQALSAASVQARATSAEGAPAIVLDAIDLDALMVQPLVSVVSAAVAAESPNPVLSDVPPAAAVATQNHEAQLKQQAALQEEARLAELGAAQQLADAQAKAWAEAEQRALAAAKSQAAQVNPAASSGDIKKTTGVHPVFTASRKRKSVPWGGLLAGLLVVLVVAAFVVPLLLPTQEYAQAVEKRLATQLQQPVHIGKLSLRILPTPRVDLTEVYVGEINQIKAKQLQLNFSFPALWGEVKRIDRVEVEGLELNGNGLPDIPVWLHRWAADANYPLTRLVFSLAKLNGEAIQLNDLEGDVMFTPEGRIHTAALHSHLGKLGLELKDGGDDALQAVMTLRGMALPLLPNWSFDELTAKGTLTRDALVLDEVDARIAGGTLQGKVRLDWQHGWSAQGSLNAKSVAMSSFNKLLEGDMDGAAEFRMHADTLAKLSDSASLEGSLVAKKGVMNGMDMVETARLHSKDNLPGGRTHFDELNSNVSFSNNAYHFRGVKITNSVLSAAGSADIVKQQLSGRVSARLSITEGMGAVDLQLGGAVTNPTLRATR